MLLVILVATAFISYMLGIINEPSSSSSWTFVYVWWVIGFILFLLEKPPETLLKIPQ